METSRFQKEISCAAQAARVAAAADAFVMREGDVDHVEGQFVKARQDVPAVFRVGLHHGHLFIREPAGFVEHIQRSFDLADVVHQGADAEHAELILRQADMPAQGQGQHADVDGMLGRVFVAVLQVRQADMGVGITQYAVHQTVDHLLDADQIDGSPVPDVIEYLVDAVAAGHADLAGRGDFLLECAAGHVSALILGFFGLGFGAVAAQGGLDDDALLDIHLHILAVLADLIDIFDALNAESLEHEWRFQPGPIQARDEHAELELVDMDVNYAGDHTVLLPACLVCVVGCLDWRQERKSIPAPHENSRV